MKWSQLFTDPATGTVSESKLWINVGKGVATWAFIYMVLQGKAEESVWWAYLLVISCHEAISRVVSWRFGRDTAQSAGGIVRMRAGDEYSADAFQSTLQDSEEIRMRRAP